jgi:hypothetical protein
MNLRNPPAGAGAGRCGRVKTGNASVTTGEAWLTRCYGAPVGTFAALERK